MRLKAVVLLLTGVLGCNGATSTEQPADAQDSATRDTERDTGSNVDDVAVDVADAADALDTASSDSGMADTPTDTTPTDCPLRPTCDAPLPAVGPKGSFRHTSSKLTAAIGSARHRGRDLFVQSGKKAWVLGKFSYGAADDDIKDEDVDVWILKGCGTTWEKVGTYQTTSDGTHPTVEGVADTGGRIYVDLSITSVGTLPIGRHKIWMSVVGDRTGAEQYIEVVPTDAKIVVSDVDGTLTSSEYASLTDIVGLPPPTAHPGAAEMMTAFAKRGYYIFYLTARPEWMTPVTRSWFPTRGFPPGLLHTTLSKAGANGAAAVTYKTNELALLKAGTGIVPSYGFGNKDSDVAAYVNGKLTPGNCYYYQLAVDLKGGTRNDDYRLLVPIAAAAEYVCK